VKETVQSVGTSFLERKEENHVLTVDRQNICNTVN
jgi:hypothetical protein